MDSKQRTKVLVQSSLANLLPWVAKIKVTGVVKIIKPVKTALVMMRAKDAVAGQIFNLGEVLVSDCTVTVDEQTGYGAVTGDQPERAEAIAILDAVFFFKNKNLTAKWSGLLTAIQLWLKEEAQEQQKEQQKEFQLVERSKVNFDTME
ncbi:MAG: phosphonate C-P lyase system protein PhnG [Desulfotomaculum sp.]|nr:phosphonate C-P lyase system protein PhnG [Desulfotomaculum sp.]MCL0081348.1 phosphonate C-P lyase system protein PhnG [Peptococcaceae bacterium]